MKKCGYCGRENDGSAAHCQECGTEFPSLAAPQSKPPSGSSKESDDCEYHFLPLSAEERRQNLVELVRCRTLFDAELLLSRLEAAGIWSFIPDENLSQTIAWNFNTYGYVRVQISPKDYDAACELLTASGHRSQS